jgi:hypothetical protein
MTLWVAATNERAIHLYESAGYTITHTRSSWITQTTLGVRRWHFMEKPVSPKSSSMFD